MKSRFTFIARFFLATLGIIGWYALIGQLFFIVHAGNVSIGEAVIRYFTFYTILTNILVALCCTFLLIRPRSELGRFFSSARTLTAITVNILIVGLIYNIVLRPLAHPQGMQHFINEILHSVIPPSFMLFWLIFVPKGGLKWSSVFLWMIYPLTYLGVILLRGSLSGYYPYPFLNVKKLGYGQVLLNSAGIAIMFIIIAWLFVAMDKLKKKKYPVHPLNHLVL